MPLLFVGDTDRIHVKCLHLLQELEDHIQTEIVDISRQLCHVLRTAFRGCKALGTGGWHFDSSVK
jgi:hypothetical protein